MAKQLNLKKGVAQFSGFVDNIRHVGENDYGRTGDWVDVAVFGGIIRVPAINSVSVDDQVIVRGYLRNNGRVIDLVTTDIVVCSNEQEIEAWNNCVDPVYHAFLSLDLNFYDKVSITNKAIPRFSARFRGVGIQFGVQLDQEQYLNIKQYNGQSLDWTFDLIRDFRVTGSEGNRNTLDTWSLRNPRLHRARSKSPSQEQPASK